MIQTILDLIMLLAIFIISVVIVWNVLPAFMLIHVIIGLPAILHFYIKII